MSEPLTTPPHEPPQFPPIVPDIRQQLPPQSRGLTAMTGAMALIVVLLIVQIWLLSAALESYLAGHHGAALPSAIFSGIIFACCVALYMFVNRIDSEVRKHEGVAPATMPPEAPSGNPPIP